jgi:glucokinase
MFIHQIKQTKVFSADDTFLALDIGGTNVTCGLVDRTGDVLATDIFPTFRGSSPDVLITHIVKRLKALGDTADRKHRPLAVAIGAPGWIKPKEGIVVTAPNLDGWVDVPITKMMSEALRLPARLENDANLYAMGEWLAGAGEGSDNQITVTLGTGVGGGLILNGSLWSGSFNSATEIGHIPLGPGYNTRCGCGRIGCLETMASANGMVRMAREWLESDRETIFKGQPSELNTEVMTELAEQGDPMSLHVFCEAGIALGQVLSAVFNLLSLERAVIGGGASGAFTFLKQPLIDYLAQHLVTAKIEEIQVVQGELGTDAPLVGAAALLNAEDF